VLAQRPKFAMFDEPDSGVDVENLAVIGKTINKFLKDKGGLLTTHSGHILRYVKIDKAHVMIQGRIACSGDPKKIFDLIMKDGYKWCEECLKTKKTHKNQ
jgi:Fe-S cluster assembly ATP-binding protein